MGAKQKPPVPKGTRYTRIVVADSPFYKTDAAGRKFKYYPCLCDCGTLSVVRSNSLKKTQSCGCLQREKVAKTAAAINKRAEIQTGSKFGRLTVLEKHHVGKNRAWRYLCECSCGNRTNVMGYLLKSGETRSCGCLRRKNHYIHGRSKTNEYRREFCHKRRGAKLKQVGTVFPRMVSMFRWLQRDKCYYCGVDISEKLHLEHKTPLSRGGLHCWTNLCVSCPSCNLRKNNKTVEEFEEYLKTT